MNLNDYLNPLKNDLIFDPDGELGKQVNFNRGNFSFDSLNKGDIVVVGIPYHMNHQLEFTKSVDLVRNELYSLAAHDSSDCKIIDAGDLKRGKNVKEILYSLKELLDLLREKGVFTLLIGGSNILNLGVLMHFESVWGKYSYTIVEPWFSLADYMPYDLVNCNLLNYYNLGSQSYYLTQKQQEWIKANYYETNRLGKIRGNLGETEPYLRDSGGCSISINAVKYADAPGQQEPYPNGLYNEEVCQLAKYTGLANNLEIFGVFDYSPAKDRNRVTAKLIAQMLWFSIEGYRLRYQEHPYSDDHFQKFLVTFDDREITFYKSERTSRWWMEVPGKEVARNQVFPCNLSDYEMACQHEIPERWLHAYRRLNFYTDKG
ncbi:MAG: hypothetical protein K9H65_00075 [Bacteroidales bacterium]|nr:hypothetical protein [Bacteroidales bacterium]